MNVTFKWLNKSNRLVPAKIKFIGDSSMAQFVDKENCPYGDKFQAIANVYDTEKEAFLMMISDREMDLERVKEFAISKGYLNINI